MFLLARMHIDMLATKTVLATLKSTLQKLPVGFDKLDTAYDTVMARIRNQGEEDSLLARQILTWLYYARRPLSLLELKHALATGLAYKEEPDLEDFDEEYLLDDDRIGSLCAGIVIHHAQSNTVAFVHYTTKEYFNRKLEFERQQDCTSDASVLHTETYLAETCLVYLMYDHDDVAQDFFENLSNAGRYLDFGHFCREHTERELSIRKWSHDFLLYAATYWGEHAGKAQRKTSEQNQYQIFEKLALLFFGQHGPMIITSKVITDGGPTDCYDIPWQLSGICLASFLGLESLVRLLIDQGDIGAANHETGWTALHMATLGNHPEIVQLLLENGIEDLDARTPDSEYPKGGGQTALIMAAITGQETVLEILLRFGADANDRTLCPDQTALHAASIYNNPNIIMSLLDQGADIEAVDGDGCTPLLCATTWNSLEAAEALIDRNASLFATGKHGETLASLAVDTKSVEMLKLLRSKEVDLNSPSLDQGVTPFFIAVGRGYHEVVEYLITELWGVGNCKVRHDQRC